MSVCIFSSLRGNDSKHFKTQIKFNSSALPRNLNIYTKNFLVHITSYSRKFLGDVDESYFEKKWLEEEPYCLVKLVLKNKKEFRKIWITRVGKTGREYRPISRVAFSWIIRIDFILIQVLQRLVAPWNVAFQPTNYWVTENFLINESVCFSQIRGLEHFWCHLHFPLEFIM